jgi:hypothetical protein
MYFHTCIDVLYCPNERQLSIIFNYVDMCSVTMMFFLFRLTPTYVKLPPVRPCLRRQSVIPNYCSIVTAGLEASEDNSLL